MATITIKIPDNALEEAQEIADEQHDGNRSAAIRELIDMGLRFDEVQRERDRLRDQLVATNRRQEEHTELVEYVRQERELQRSRRDLERILKEANILTRWKWKLTGVPVDTDEET